MSMGKAFAETIVPIVILASGGALVGDSSPRAGAVPPGPPVGRTATAVLEAPRSPASAGTVGGGAIDLPIIGECAWRRAEQPPAADRRWHGKDPTTHILMVNYCNGPVQYEVVSLPAITPAHCHFSSPR